MGVGKREQEEGREEKPWSVCRINEKKKLND